MDLGYSVNSAAEWLCRSPAINAVLSNALIAAMILTVILMIVVMALYGDAVRELGWKQAARASFYTWLAVSAFLFAHYYAVRRSVDAESAKQGLNAVYQSVRSSQGGPSYKVVPEIFAEGGDGDPFDLNLYLQSRSEAAPQSATHQPSAPQPAPYQPAPYQPTPQPASYQPAPYQPTPQPASYQSAPQSASYQPAPSYVLPDNLECELLSLENVMLPAAAPLAGR